MQDKAPSIADSEKQKLRVGMREQQAGRGPARITMTESNKKIAGSEFTPKGASRTVMFGIGQGSLASRVALLTEARARPSTATRNILAKSFRVIDF